MTRVSSSASPPIVGRQSGTSGREHLPQIALTPGSGWLRQLRIDGALKPIGKAVTRNHARCFELSNAVTLRRGR